MRFLQAQEAKVLNCLLIHQGEVVRTLDLIEYVWRGCKVPASAEKMVQDYIWRARAGGWPIICVKRVGFVIPWTRPVEIEEQELRKAA